MTADVEPHVDRVTAARRSKLRARAILHPEGLPPHKFTAGFTKADALMFWTDAKAVGLVRVGITPRGARLFAFPSGSIEPNRETAL